MKRKGRKGRHSGRLNNLLSKKMVRYVLTEKGILSWEEGRLTSRSRAWLYPKQKTLETGLSWRGERGVLGGNQLLRKKGGWGGREKNGMGVRRGRKGRSSRPIPKKREPALVLRKGEEEKLPYSPRRGEGKGRGEQRKLEEPHKRNRLDVSYFLSREEEDRLPISSGKGGGKKSALPGRERVTAVFGGTHEGSAPQGKERRPGVIVSRKKEGGEAFDCHSTLWGGKKKVRRLWFQGGKRGFHSDT